MPPIPRPPIRRRPAWRRPTGRRARRPAPGPGRYPPAGPEYVVGESVPEFAGRRSSHLPGRGSGPGAGAPVDELREIPRSPVPPTPGPQSPRLPDARRRPPIAAVASPILISRHSCHGRQTAAPKPKPEQGFRYVWGQSAGLWTKSAGSRRPPVVEDRRRRPARPRRPAAPPACTPISAELGRHPGCPGIGVARRAGGRRWSPPPGPRRDAGPPPRRLRHRRHPPPPQ